MASAPESGRSLTSDRWNDEFLESMRYTGDPAADDVVSRLFEDGNISAVNALMRTLVENEYPLPEALPAAVSNYLRDTGDLPSWANPDMIAKGERVFWRFGPRVILVLHCYALPFCYVARKGVQVLALTGRLTGNPARRIVETAQMMVDVLQPRGLTTAEGRGRRTIQKVRLMHAAVRRLAQMSAEWQHEFGLPVHQEDLAGTLLSFSYLTLEGLRKSGITVSPEDQEAYIHCWRVAGHLLGLRDDMNPENMTSAEVLTSAIVRRQFAASPEGKMMTDALVKTMQYELPGDILDGLPALFIRYFLGAEYASMIGIDEKRFTRLAVVPLRLAGGAVSEILHDSALVSRLAEKLGQALIQAIVFVGRGGNRPSFAIPAELRQQWGVNWTS